MTPLSTGEGLRVSLLSDLAAGLYQVQLLNGNSNIQARASLIKQ